MYALRIENTSETDPRSYEATKAVANESPEKFWGFNGIRSHDLRDTGAMLYQLSYEALLVVHFHALWSVTLTFLTDTGQPIKEIELFSSR